MYDNIQAAGVPVDFEQHFFSEVQPLMSVSLDDVANSISRNGICLKGIFKASKSNYFLTIVDESVNYINNFWWFFQEV